MLHLCPRLAEHMEPTVRQEVVEVQEGVRRRGNDLASEGVVVGDRPLQPGRVVLLLDCGDVLYMPVWP